ncbi:MAG: hypothetical protein KKA70_15860 [Proteobacteria bacterium]|nr:hypothetical protein [Pseudomonadota bacterium]
MKQICLFFMLFFLFWVPAISSAESGVPPRVFVSDGCSLWPDGDWGECCFSHDEVYWKGGSSELRAIADIQLRNCIAGKDYPVMAWFMYFGVRLFGHPWLPTSFRWGFGWPWPHAYED